MDSHQRPLDFQSNALLLSYSNTAYTIAITWNRKITKLIKELKLKKTKTFGVWKAKPANSTTAPDAVARAKVLPKSPKLSPKTVNKFI